MTVVAYCGNFDAPHSTETHVAKALENLGHQVRRLPEQRMEWANLPVQVEGADLFLWTRTAGFDPADLEGQANAIKLLDIPSAGFHLDRWVGLNREPDVHRSPFFRLDYLFTADGGHPDFWLEHGINHFWSPPRHTLRRSETSRELSEGLRRRRRIRRQPPQLRTSRMGTIPKAALQVSSHDL